LNKCKAECSFFKDPIAITKDYEVLYTQEQVRERADKDKSPSIKSAPAEPLVNNLSKTLVDIIERVNKMMGSLSKAEEAKSTNTFDKSAEILMNYIKKDFKLKTEKEFSGLDAKILKSILDEIKKSEGIIPYQKFNEVPLKKCNKCDKVCVNYQSLTLSCGHSFDLTCLTE
jgi:hypothetical protein